MFIPVMFLGIPEKHTVPVAFLLIDREGYKIQKYALKEGLCPKCGYRLDGIEL
jgi:hypothetical protein